MDQKRYKQELPKPAPQAVGAWVGAGPFGGDDERRFCGVTRLWVAASDSHGTKMCLWAVAAKRGRS